MIEEKQESTDLMMLDRIKEQHANFVSQRDQTQINLNQLVGAVFACETLINLYKTEITVQTPEVQTSEMELVLE